MRVKDVAPFDNGASYFHSGLVRVMRDGKYGLASDLGILTTPLYDGMNEFDKDYQGWKASIRVVSVEVWRSIGHLRVGSGSGWIDEAALRDVPTTLTRRTANAIVLQHVMISVR